MLLTPGRDWIRRFAADGPEHLLLPVNKGLSSSRLVVEELVIVIVESALVVVLTVEVMITSTLVNVNNALWVSFKKLPKSRGRFLCSMLIDILYISIQNKYIWIWIYPKTQ